MESNPSRHSMRFAHGTLAASPVAQRGKNLFQKAHSAHKKTGTLASSAPAPRVAAEDVLVNVHPCRQALLGHLRLHRLLQLLERAHLDLAHPLT